MKNIQFSGHDTVALAEQYGTPLYVMSEDIIRERIESVKKAFEEAGADYEINFAGKAFTNIAMCKIVDSEGIALDAVSKGEIMTAQAAGFPMNRICYHGSNKKISELKYALENGVGLIVVDSEDELKKLIQVTDELDQDVNIMFRVSPGVEAHTHELIQTGTQDTKFGLPYSLAKDIIVSANAQPHISVVGIHCHIGSQIVDEVPFIAAADKMVGLYQDIRNDGVDLRAINLGGGFGIPYLKGDEYFETLKYIPKLVAHVRTICADRDVPMPKLIVEPGRFLVCEAGATLYTIGTVKDVPGVRKYVSVDGGMNDNPRPALYGAEYEAVVCNGKNSEKMEPCRVSGRACETDTLIDSAMLNQPQVGDILMVKNTGAYNYSMASRYNRYPIPAVVLLSGDRSAVMVERESYEDLLSHDRVPDWLK